MQAAASPSADTEQQLANETVRGNMEHQRGLGRDAREKQIEFISRTQGSQNIKRSDISYMCNAES